MSSFLICYQFAANIGYAIEPLEITFYEVIKRIVGNNGQIYLGYKHFNNGKPRWLSINSSHLVELDYKDMTAEQLSNLAGYIKTHDIHYVLAFDLHVGASICKAFREGGVKKTISYYGCPMSSLNSGIKLFLKRAQTLLTLNKPDHYIFESFGMQKTAIQGRGINPRHTSVVHLGIDANKYISIKHNNYVYRIFNIPNDRKIFFYAGHMEKRKGVDVIIKAAAELANERNRTDIHFLICGNKPGEDKEFLCLYNNTAAEDHITFGGYRNDLPELMAGCYAAIIASTGWDSFPRTSLEVAAAGLPLLVSNLPGLNETIEDDASGLLFEPGNHFELADKIVYLLENLPVRNTFSKKSVQRISDSFTLETQKYRLEKVIRKVISLE